MEPLGEAATGLGLSHICMLMTLSFRSQSWVVQVKLLMYWPRFWWLFGTGWGRTNFGSLLRGLPPPSSINDLFFVGFDRIAPPHLRFVYKVRLLLDLKEEVAAMARKAFAQVLLYTSCILSSNKRPFKWSARLWLPHNQTVTIHSVWCTLENYWKPQFQLFCHAKLGVPGLLIFGTRKHTSFVIWTTHWSSSIRDSFHSAEILKNPYELRLIYLLDYCCVLLFLLWLIFRPGCSVLCF